jgi:hypothetical protein
LFNVSKVSLPIICSNNSSKVKELLALILETKLSVYTLVGALSQTISVLFLFSLLNILFTIYPTTDVFPTPLHPEIIIEFSIGIKSHPISGSSVFNYLTNLLNKLEFFIAAEAM